MQRRPGFPSGDEDGEPDFVPRKAPVPGEGTKPCRGHRFRGLPRPVAGCIGKQHERSRTPPEQEVLSTVRFPVSSARSSVRDPFAGPQPQELLPSKGVPGWQLFCRAGGIAALRAGAMLARRSRAEACRFSSSSKRIPRSVDRQVVRRGSRSATVTAVRGDGENHPNQGLERRRADSGRDARNAEP